MTENVESVAAEIRALRFSLMVLVGELEKRDPTLPSTLAALLIEQSKAARRLEDRKAFDFLSGMLTGQTAS